MNAQKDLIQHIAVLTVAPGYLNFSQPRSSEILHVGLEETRLLLRDCLSIMAVEGRGRDRDIFRAVRDVPALAPYARLFRETEERIGGLMEQTWEDELEGHRALEPVISELDAFLSSEHWYDVGYARLVQSAGGAFYSERSAARVNFVPNWRCASLFFSDAVAGCVHQALEQRDSRVTESVPLLSLAPPEGYLWMARTYAPQSPQNLINYWEAMLPGARKVRIRQMVSSHYTV